MLKTIISFGEFLNAIKTNGEYAFRVDGSERLVVAIDSDLNVASISLYSPENKISLIARESVFGPSYSGWLCCVSESKKFVLEVNRQLKKIGCSLRNYGDCALGFPVTIHGPKEKFIVKVEKGIVYRFMVPRDSVDKFCEILAGQYRYRRPWLIDESEIDNIKKNNDINDLLDLDPGMYGVIARVALKGEVDGRKKELDAEELLKLIDVDAKYKKDYKEYVIKSLDAVKRFEEKMDRNFECSIRTLSYHWSGGYKFPVPFSGFIDDDVVHELNLRRLNLWIRVGVPVIDEFMVYRGAGVECGIDSFRLIYAKKSEGRDEIERLINEGEEKCRMRAGWLFVDPLAGMLPTVNGG
ncbi:hypothetical protein [Ottowia testudinis]|uniref:Uncharacterized protein n=1 Tax=Ottowia testudinis TaxID=2816950 RepID=A0A975CKR0_9BURK|nr:hypothetical protein [Ottowia testudinis]QTD45268.1 hypothetical protein J1M35_20005 [Ottowia testudinis]